jgi:hypothetical protein
MAGWGQSSSGNSSWTRSYKGSSNSWDKALQSAYGAVGAVGEGTGKYTPNYDSAISSAESLVGKDYTADLNQLAQDELAQEQKEYNDQLGASGMRELQFRADVQDDWAKRRTTASTQAAIDAQGMQTSAIDILNSTIANASGYELDNISADLERALALVEAAAAGAGSEQDWEQMVADLLAAESTSTGSWE